MINKVPEYNKYMYLNGAKPEEIMMALRQKVFGELMENETEDEPETVEIISKVEVKK